MSYNLHPLIVHFPIALLFLYSVIKILPFEKWLPSVAWKHIQRVLLFVGVLGAFVAQSTGELAEHLTRPNHQVVDMHSTFATIATTLYCILLAEEIITVARSYYESKLSYKIILFIEKILCNRILSKTLAIFALVAISVTGLLGGVMVYGVNTDPIAEIVLKILGIEI